MPITIATWNVNSIRTRLHQLLPWLESARPDIVLLQELKCVNEAFPALEIETLGYNIGVHGQKTYNGVAILSKFPLEDIERRLPTLHTEDAEQARYIEALATTPIGVFRVASVYVPNGQEIGSDKFSYKLRFLEALEQHINTLKTYGEPLVIGGDYNVAPQDADVFDPKSLNGSVCFHPEERKRLRRVLHAGMLDAYRLVHNENDGACPYTWWDYRAGGFEQNKGMRIDHLLLSAQAADKMKNCTIQRELRGQERPSDHVPVMATFE
jgi:exodeoxyribonuclease-3